MGLFALNLHLLISCEVLLSLPSEKMSNNSSVQSSYSLQTSTTNSLIQLFPIRCCYKSIFISLVISLVLWSFPSYFFYLLFYLFTYFIFLRDREVRAVHDMFKMQVHSCVIAFSILFSMPLLGFLTFRFLTAGHY